ncbi:unnamed protein product, partial [Prunus brigantina]
MISKLIKCEINDIMVLATCEVHGMDYKHYFIEIAHMHIMLQLALVAALKDVAPSCWLLFAILNSIIKLITASPKCHGELRST